MSTVQGLSPFYLADKLIDPGSNSIVSDGETIHVEPKAMRVLVSLADNAGQVVTRETLEDTVWADMIVGPDALTNTVIKLRRALGDNAKNAQFIETIPKTGYRLIAPVRMVNEGEAPLARRLAAILYADVAEYSRLTGVDEERTHRILSASLDHFSESIQDHNGKVVHYAGDAILAEFGTVTEAINCAVAVQREFSRRDAVQADTLSVQFRVGINLGEVIVDRDDIYGDGVNIAARLEGLADAGGVCISESVFAAVGNKLPYDYEFMGEQKVKNITESVRAYRVHFSPTTQSSRPARKLAKRFASIAAILLAVIITTLLVQQQFSIDFSREAKIESPPVSNKPTLAVLPFANVSVDAGEDDFAKGITIDVITDLTKISGLNVISHSSIKHLEDQAIEPEKICNDLGAQFLVEGTIQKIGDRVRVNVQMVECQTRQLFWAERYDRKFGEIFELQDEVITQVVSKVSVTLTPSESAQVSRLPTSNLQAYDYYLRAEKTGYIGGTLNLAETLKLYENAVRLDPEFAEAHAGFARAAVEAWRSDSGVIHAAKARAMAYESASRALEIDPANGQAYSVLAVLQLADGHHDAAIESAHKAVELVPGSALAHLDLGLVLAYSGEPKQGIEAIETALRLNPKPNADTELYTGIVYFIDGQYQLAESAFSRAEGERAGSEPLWTFLAAARALLGHKDEAAKVVVDLLGEYPNSSVEYYRARDTYFRRPQDLEILLTGMKEAGLPKWAFDFQGEDRDRLDEKELRNIVENKTWIGKHAMGTEFFQQIDRSGSMAYRSSSSIQTGKVTIRQDMYCQHFDGTALDRDLCGYIYRNPEGSKETQDEYVISMPASLRYFTVTP